MEHAGSAAFKSPAYQRIAEELIHRTVEGMDTSPSGLMSACKDSEDQQVISAAAMEKVDEKRANEFIDDFLRHFRLDELQREKAAISRRVAAESDEKKKAALIKHQQELQQQIHELMES